MASGWKTIQDRLSTGFSQASQGASQAIGTVDLSQTGGKIVKGWASFTQNARERIGTAEDITELPPEYLQLEKKVDALRTAHVAMLSVSKAYNTSSYDYPLNAAESASEIGGQLAHSVSFWANAATQGTNLPSPQVSSKPSEVHKTLPHALSRAAAVGAIDLGAEERLGKALQAFAVAQEKIGQTRLQSDATIANSFTKPWSLALNQRLLAASRARNEVRTARLALDSARHSQSLVNTSDGQKVEQSRLEVEAAEERLYNTTEDAMALMRGILEDPEPIQTLGKFVKAQQQFYSQAAELMGSISPEIDELAVKSEEEYRKHKV